MVKNARLRGERNKMRAREKKAEMRMKQTQDIGSEKSRVGRIQNIHYQRLILQRKNDILGSFRCKGRAYASFERYRRHMSSHKRWTFKSTQLRRFNRAPKVIVMKVVKNLKTRRKSTRVLRRFGGKGGEYFFKPSSDGIYDVHFESVNFKCSKCSNIFDNLERFQKHAANAHPGVDLHLCSLCGGVFEDEASLHIHERTHVERSLKCTQCVDVFSSVTLLEQHMKACHKKSCGLACCSEETQGRKVGKQSGNNAVGPYKCHHCSRTFKTKHMRNGHLAVHRKPKRKKFIKDVIDQDTLENSKNDKCHETLTQPTAFEPGSDNQTPNEGMKCTTCEMIFVSKKELKGHKCPLVLGNKETIEIDQEKQLKCSKCDNKFDDKVLLDAHTIFHNGDNLQYQCPPCGKSFSDLSRLITHALKSKSHDDPEKCFQCGKTLKSRKMIKQHLMMIHYKSQIFKCQLCSMNFLNMQAVEMHVSKCHQTDAKPFDVNLKKTESVNVKDEPMSEETLGRPSNTLCIHQCKHCSRKFKDEVKLKDHEIGHEAGDEQYDCPPCGKVFPNLVKLQKHVMNNKGHKNPLACPKCGKTYKKRTSVRDHILSHFKDEWFPCDVCSKRFTHRKSLKSHMDWHSGRFKCKSCGKHATSKHELTVHERTHSEELFMCKTCGRGFKSKKGLLTHSDCSSTEGSALKARIKQQYEEKEARQHGQSFSCSECDKTFKRFYNLNLHRKSAHGGENRKRFSCNQCDKTYLWKTSLQVHVVYAHSDKEKQLFSCELCDKSFDMRSALRRHLNWHAGRFKCKTCGKHMHTQYGLTLHERKHSTEPVFTCETCGRGFKHKKSLLTHSGCSATKGNALKLKQQIEARGPYLCPTCNKSFKLKSYLRVHVLARHTNIRSYKCRFCGKGFVNSSQQKLHERVHNPMRKKVHMCDRCGRNFVKEVSLADHIRIHTGELPFKCTECDEYFRTKLHRHNHFNRVHLKDNLYVCTVCGIVEATASQFKTHMNYHIRPFICQHCGKNCGSLYSVREHEKIHLKVSKWARTGVKRDRKKYNEQRKEKRREKGKSKRSKHEKTKEDGSLHNEIKAKGDGLIHNEIKYAIEGMYTNDDKSGGEGSSNLLDYVIGGPDQDSKATCTELLEAINQNLKKPQTLDEEISVNIY